jgi:two-component system, chemotaxis family, response regulator WspF
MRIAVVNDDPVAVELLRRVIESEPGDELAWTAADGAEAVRRCQEDPPELVLMDLAMPVMDGVESTRLIHASCSCAVLIVTTGVKGQFAQVYEAMSHGALNVVEAPFLSAAGNQEGADALRKHIRNVERLLDSQWREITGGPTPAPGPPSALPLVVIGASTGGPQAVAEILSGLPRNLAAGIVIVQHVDVQFADGLAIWLTERTGFPVKLAQEGDRPSSGTALLASTRDHLIMTARGELAYTSAPRESVYRPSVDVFFKSLPPRREPRSVAVLLTGMGKDGAEGLKVLRQGNWLTIAQDEKTSIVYGMPKAAARIGAATAVLPLQKIAAKIAEAVFVSIPVHVAR